MQPKKDSKYETTRLKTMLRAAVTTAVLGGVLVIASFIVPPTGVIDNSVLAALGELLTFSGSCFGIDTNYKLKTRMYRDELKSRLHHESNDDIDEQEESPDNP